MDPTLSDPVKFTPFTNLFFIIKLVCLGDVKTLVYSLSTKPASWTILCINYANLGVDSAFLYKITFPRARFGIIVLKLSQKGKLNGTIL